MLCPNILTFQSLISADSATSTFDPATNCRIEVAYVGNSSQEMDSDKINQRFPDAIVCNESPSRLNGIEFLRSKIRSSRICCHCVAGLPHKLLITFQLGRWLSTRWTVPKSGGESLEGLLRRQRANVKKRIVVVVHHPYSHEPRIHDGTWKNSLLSNVARLRARCANSRISLPFDDINSARSRACLLTSA